MLTLLSSYKILINLICDRKRSRSQGVSAKERYFSVQDLQSLCSWQSQSPWRHLYVTNDIRVVCGFQVRTPSCQSTKIWTIRVFKTRFFRKGIEISKDYQAYQHTRWDSIILRISAKRRRSKLQRPKVTCWPRVKSCIPILSIDDVLNLNLF